MLLVLLMGQSCSADKQSESPSTNLNDLKKFINLERYTPTEVKWTYTKIGEASDRVPGPNDYCLRAEMTFSPETIQRLKEDYKLLSVTYQQFFKENYEFDWLTRNQLQKLRNSDMMVYRPGLFGIWNSGGYIFLGDNTVLLYYPMI